MASLIWLFQFLLYFLRYEVASSSSSLYSVASFSSFTHPLCRRDQRSALLQFKHMFTINSSASFHLCDDFGIPSYPKTMYWNENNATDCCYWDGVTCDRSTGHVIGLDLSCSQLYGTIHSNSSLFQLSQLQRLNLAYNNFNGSHISNALGRLASLTHLNLSYSSFSGSIPSEISHISKLMSLDLSYVGELVRFEPSSLRMFLKNVTQLQELVLSGVNISSVLPNSLINMSSLTTLDLGGTRLLGNLPDGIFHLPNLQKLLLPGNDDVNVNLPKVTWRSCSSLRELDLDYTKFSGELPDSIGFLKSLTYLTLSNCKLQGSIPKSLGNLTQITSLDLSHNGFNGEVPSTFSNLKQLTFLYLSHNNLGGKIPDAFAALTILEHLLLQTNNFKGGLTSWVANLTKLVHLSISNNQLTGSIPSNLSGLQNLQNFMLSNNSLNGTIPSCLSNLPSLKWVDLSYNRITGQIPEFRHDSPLEFINLSDNKLHGPIPPSISTLVNLTTLLLDSNDLSGVVDLQKLQNLEDLSLSNTNLSVIISSNLNITLPKLRFIYMTSCKIEEFPNFLRASENLDQLDISDNKIHGQIPDWAGFMWKNSLSYLNLSHNFLTHIKKLPWENLETFDLSFNLLQGPLPIPPLSIRYFFISKNSLSAKIPLSICNASSLRILDLSHNKLSGEIPQCLGNSSRVLSVLDLRSNRFQGSIPSMFAKHIKLRSLNLNGNQLGGPLPRSLISCRSLEVLDIGNNKINDTFPYWLGTLPELQVLVLKSNRFHEPVGNQTIKSRFSKLRIIDLSYNEFNGHLPVSYFKYFNAMKNNTMADKQYMGDNGSYYHDSVTVTMKGVNFELVKILTVFTTIDFSCNNFSGEIPNIVGTLDSLIVLNLSHNSLSGHIPESLGGLKNLESLDLSSNKLVGEIPSQLTKLSFLAVLNLSWNNLNGPIPQGQQFNTFESGSYVGNSRLCGFPLPKECDDNHTQVQPQPVSQRPEDDSDFDGFTWKIVMIGYGCGLPLGLFLGFLMFLIGRPKFIVRIFERKRPEKVIRLRRTGHTYRHNGRRN